jgi:hypothetical protein
MKNTLLDAAGLEVASSLSELTDLDPGQGIRLMTRMIVMAAFIVDSGDTIPVYH